MNKKQLAELELLSPPGDTIRETLEYHKIEVESFAEVMGISIDDADDLISGIKEIDEELATKLEKMFGIDKSFWIAREKNYREKLACLMGGH